MPPLSDLAAFILDRMDPHRQYEPRELHALVPDTGVERLGEIMHELWIGRHVERAGPSGWRRHRSAPPHRSQTVSGEPQTVKPEELFDYASFADFFK
jgi:hypothetical protein